MKKILIAICFLAFISSCASFTQSTGEKKMKRYNMYLNDHPDRDRDIIKKGKF